MSKRKPLFAVKYVFLALYSVIIILPLLFVLVSSFKTNEEIFGSAFSLPGRLHYENYVNIFKEYRFQNYFFNSLGYAVVVCAVSAVITTMAAYGIGRMKWRLSKPTLALLLSGIMIPLHAILVPLYIMVARFKLPNQVALMLLFIASSVPTSVFLIVGFLNNVPRTLEESAVIDGCSIPRMFFTIVCPIIKPAIATVTIFNFMSVWNDLMLSLVFLSQEKLKTLQLGILRFKSAFYSDYGLLLAAIVVGVIPSIVVFLMMSDRIVSGITAGAVKG